MNGHTGAPSDPVSRIIEGWMEGYKHEAVSENGDPEGFVERIRALAEEADPATATHRALSGFLELLELEES